MAQAKAFRIYRVANDDGPGDNGPGDDGPDPAPHRVALSLLRREGADLTARQMGIFLAVYLDEEQHTVRGLATLFHICKPAVRRTIDRLGELGLARCGLDPRDCRSVLVHRTELGWAFLRELRRAVALAADDAGCATAPRAGAPLPRREAAPPRPAGYGPAAASAFD